jgi:uncharacterized membrane protein
MVTMKDIKTIREDLKKQKPADLADNQDRPLSNREVVKQLASTLLKMRKRGFTTSALVELLKKHQIAIKNSDLNRHLRSFQCVKLTEAKPVRLENQPDEIAELPINDL